MRLSQYLIEDAFENGMAKQPGTKIPTIYNSKYGMDLQPQPQTDEQDKEDDVKLNQFNDFSDDAANNVGDDVSSREKKIDDALSRLRAVILGTDGDDDSSDMDDDSFNFDDDEIEDEDEEMPQDPNMPNVGSDINAQPSLDNNPNIDNQLQATEETDQAIPRRFVKNAHLVYKRKTPEGLYEELWIYNIGKESRMKEYDIRREILRGTDIEQRDTESEDGSQYYEIWTAGNAQMLHIVGLPN